MKKPLATRTLFLVSMLILLLGGCTPDGDSTEVPTSIPATLIPESTQPPTATISSPTLILLAGIDADQILVAQLEPVVTQFATDSGLVFERREILGPDSIPQNIQFVVAIGPIPTIIDMVPALPDVQFVAVGVDGLPDLPNLTTMSLGGTERYNQAFMAGYIAAMSDPEFRVGIISVGDVEGQRYRDSFMNGVVYFCGFCNPIYPPYWEYPLFYEVSPGAAPEVRQQAAEDLIARSVTTIHVAPEVADDSLLNYLANRGLMIVGTGQPPDTSTENWIGSVESDYVSLFEQVLRDVFQGGALGQVSNSPVITHVNPGYMSEGRLNHLEEVMGQLENGLIDPLGE